jgi:hypothetical protein
MTTDALLNIVLSVGVPGLMALLGGVLAARTLPYEAGKRNPEIKIWSSGFVFLFVISVVLAFVQQTRNTTQQQLAAQIAHDKDLIGTGNIRYMQGQLDSINKVLGSLSSQSDPRQIVGILKSMSAPLVPTPSAAPQGVEAPAIQRMSNGQLRERVIQFANAMRQFDADSEIASEAQATKEMREMAAIPKDEKDKQQQAWQASSDRRGAMMHNYTLQVEQTFVGEATEYRDELLRRLGPQKPLSPTEQTMLFWGLPGITVNHWSVVGTAQYLEGLARILP